jgi:hypothetical protein
MSIEDTRTHDDARTASPADRSTAVTLLLSVFVSPLGYYYVGRRKLALVNLLTLNYLALGFVAVPIHTYLLTLDAEQNGENEGGGSNEKRPPSQVSKQSVTSSYLRQYQSAWIHAD